MAHSVTFILATAIILLQTITGAYFWALIRRKAGPIELLGMGFGLGSALSTLSGVVFFGYLPLPIAVLFPTIASSLVAMSLFLLRRNFLGYLGAYPHSQIPRLPAVVAVAIGVVLGAIAILVNLTRYPLQWQGTIASYHGDFLFFEALSTSLATLGPADSIFMSGTQIRYHWMVYAWSGQIAELAGGEPFEILTRVLPLASLIGSVLLVVSWTQRLSQSRWAPSLAVVLLVTGGYIGAAYGTVLNFDSPSQQLATVWMLAAAAALWETTELRVRARPWAGSALPQTSRFWILIIAVAILTGVTATGKASAAAVLIGGWLLVPLIGRWRHERWWLPSLIATISGLAAAGALTFAYVVGSQGGGGLRLGGLLDKASSVQGLNPSTNAWGIVAGTLLLMLAVSFRWAGLLWLGFDRTTRWKPITVFGVGLAACGLLALAFASEGINDTWFPLAASAPLSVVSAVGATAAVNRLTPIQEVPRNTRLTLLIGSVAAAIVGALLVGLLWTFGPGPQLSLRWLGPLAGIAIAVIAALLIRHFTNLRGNDLQQFVATVIVSLVLMSAVARGFGIWSDRFGVQPEQGLTSAEFRPSTTEIDSLDRSVIMGWSDEEVTAGRWLNGQIHGEGLIASNVTFSPLVPALTGVPTFVSGIRYQAPYGRLGINGEILERENASLDFINNPTRQAAREMCEHDVEWLWIDPRRTSADDWEAFGQTVLAYDTVVLVQRNTSAC